MWDRLASAWPVLTALGLLILVPLWDGIIMATLKRLDRKGLFKPWMNKVYEREFRAQAETAETAKANADRLEFFETSFHLHMEARTSAENRLANAIEKLSTLVEKQTEKIDRTEKTVARLEGEWDGRERRAHDRGERRQGDT